MSISSSRKIIEKRWFTKVLLKDILIIAKLNKVLDNVCRYNQLNEKRLKQMINLVFVSEANEQPFVSEANES